MGRTVIIIRKQTKPLKMTTTTTTTQIKEIKSEQWTIKKLMEKVNNGDITKPKVQRAKKWIDKPNKLDSKANEKNFIEFLFNRKNSTHSISFSQSNDIIKTIFKNYDGNNRINAIMHFVTFPFELFIEYLDELFIFVDIDMLESLSTKEKDQVKDIFKRISYTDIIEIDMKKYFTKMNLRQIYQNMTEQEEKDNELDNIMNRLKEKLKINGEDRFDLNVFINVNLFIGYSEKELNEVFLEINKYNSNLTENEALASRLSNKTNFIIQDNVLEQSIKNEITKYYEEKSEGEVLQCYKFDIDSTMNAFDFIVGFQNDCFEKYKIGEKTADSSGTSLFFKLFQSIYADKKIEADLFTTENINDFIENIIYAYNILERAFKDIFTEKIDETLFNNNCANKMKLKKNALFLILSAIIGYKKINSIESYVINSIQKALLYHFLVDDIDDNNKKKKWKALDFAKKDGGGALIDAESKDILKEPNKIIEEMTREAMSSVIKILFEERSVPFLRKLENGNNRNNKRIKRVFHEKILMFYFYKEKVPTNLLNNKFSLEHIFPFSSHWSNELDIERFGNIFPIIHEINNKRSNHHISEYRILDTVHNFIPFVSDLIPHDTCYNNIINHNEKTPNVISNEKYNLFCDKNEKIYLENFLNCLF